VLEQQVVRLANRAVDNVLDRDDTRVGAAGGNGRENIAEACLRAPRKVTEDREGGVLGERAGLAGERY
jgi:hypothetical protein